MLPDGRDTYRTFVGFLLTIFTLTTLITYGSYQLIKLMQNEDSIVQLRDLRNKYALNETFGLSDQFTVAAGLIDYENRDRVDMPDPEIGQLKIYHKHWTSNSTIGFKELKTRVCDQEDFQSIDKSALYPVLDHNQQDVQKHAVGKFRCLDESQDLKLWGNYNTDQAQNLMIVFEKCDITKRPKGAKCKTEKEIETWMDYKYIGLVMNEARFVQHKFGESRVERRSAFSWNPLSY